SDHKSQRGSCPVSTPSKIGLSALAAGAAFVGGTTQANAAALSEIALPWPWALPFIGLLMSIAVGPLLAPRFLYAHYGKIAFMWSILTVAPLAALHGMSAALSELAHAATEYSSFIILLAALYVVAGGILITGRLEGTPLVNTAILALGTAIASIVGTTG